MDPSPTSCPRCGAGVTTRRFCSECGAPLSSDAGSTTLDLTSGGGERKPSTADPFAPDLTDPRTTVSLTKLLVLCGLALAVIVALAFLLLSSDNRDPAEGAFSLSDLDHVQPR